MYTINGNVLTTNRDLSIIAYVHSSAPQSLIDKQSEKPRIPEGLARRKIHLRAGESVAGIAQVISYVEVDMKCKGGRIPEQI